LTERCTFALALLARLIWYLPHCFQICDVAWRIWYLLSLLRSSRVYRLIYVWLCLHISPWGQFVVYNLYTGWPKKVSHYQESSLNRQWG